MTNRGTVFVYDKTTIYLHWLTVILVSVLWVVGMTGDWFPRGPQRTAVWSVHVALGFAASVAVLARIVWRMTFGRSLPPANPGILHIASETMHYLLLAMLVAVLATGIANASYRGFNIFGVWHMPQFGAGDRATRRSINEWHELAAHGTMILAAVHATAALLHQHVWRDGLIDRMRP
jgi:cytochrome b561